MAALLLGKGAIVSFAVDKKLLLLTHPYRVCFIRKRLP